MAEVVPNQTIYVNNLNEKVKKEELKKSLYALFSQFGPILDIVALKTEKMRGQAFVVFKEIGSATNALRQMQNFPFYDKPLKLQYAKAKSDVVAKLDGSFQEKKPTEKRKAEDKEKKPPVKKAAAPKKAAPAAPAAASAATAMDTSAPASAPAQPLQPRPQPPNRVLFVENLPDECTPLMLQMLFQQFPGFKEIRMVPGQKVCAFVEYETELESTVAMNGLQHFKITADNLMLISYARK